MVAVMNLCLALLMVGSASEQLREMRHRLANEQHAKQLAMDAFKRLKEQRTT